MTFTPGVLVLIGIGIIGGTLGATLFRRFKIPQVLGYIVAGLVIGQSGFKLVTPQDITALEPFSMFALGVIGFLVGAEIHLTTFKKYGKQFSSILLLEGILAFLLAGLTTGALLFWVTRSFSVAVAGGVVFGSIASATDPASTMNVLWENRTAGIFTTTLITVIALDDALAMALYGLGSGISQMVSGSGGGSSVILELLHIALELGGSLVLGAITGALTTWLFRHSNQYENSIASASGIYLFVIGLGIALNLDVILITMTSAIIFVNVNPHRAKRFVEYVQGIATPVYVFFFVLIGARISLSAMPLWIWGLVALYVIFRSSGKFLGAFLGARISNSPQSVQKNIGLGLFSQGGVAIGLSIMAGHHLDSIIVVEGISLGDTIISVVAMTTFLVQIIGPAMVKIAAHRSGEVGKNINEEDLMAQKEIVDYVKVESQTASPEMPATQLMTIFSSVTGNFIPVVDEQKRLQGIIGMPELRAILGDTTLLPWLLASDIMQLDYPAITENCSITKGMELSDQVQQDELPVIIDDIYCGIFDRRDITQQIRSELIKNQGV